MGLILPSINYVRRLHKLGVAVDVVCTTLATKTEVIQPESFERDIEGVHVNYMRTKKLFPLGKHSFGLFYIPELRQFLKDNIGKYDVLHSHGFRDYLTLVSCQEAFTAGVPYINQPRGTLPYQGHSIAAKSMYDILLGRNILRKAGACIALSNREVNSFLGLGVNHSKIRVINNGIDTTDYDSNTSGHAFRDKHGIKEQFVVLYLGRIHKIKGIDIMVRSVARLRRQGINVAAVVVGPDEGYGKTLVRLAEEESFEQLYIVPVVSGKEKQQVFGAADALVYAAEVEDFGVVAFEGILSGVPTIVASSTGCGEIVSRLDAGFLVKYGDIDGLTSVLHGILQAPDAARARTLRVRTQVISALDWSDVAKEALRVYGELNHG